MIYAILSLTAGAAVHATSEGSGVLCSNTCATSGNGVCDDGGPDSLFGTCDLGTDCEDCGEREGDSSNCQDDSSWSDIEHGNGQHTCKDFAHQRFWCTDFGTYSEAARLACPVSCGLCTRALAGCECAGVNNYMGVGEECTPERLYNGLQWCYADRETCPNALQSELDEINSQNLGFVYCGDVDFTDEECNETCAFSEDGRCDDGGIGSVSSACPLGSDCEDCGPRPVNPDGVAVSIDITYFSNVADCVSQVAAIGAEAISSTFPATPEDDAVCIATGDASSESVTCDALGVVTKKPYKDSACGDNGGKQQGEKKWSFLLQGSCYETTFNGSPAVARMDWEGPCQAEEPNQPTCYAREGKMKIKNMVESEEFSSGELTDDCACQQHCRSLLSESGDQLYAYFTWNENKMVCQCFAGRLKKYKENQGSGFFSGEL